ncbi:MAG TPA: VOC family protein [Acidimicrobiales bacterium]
MQPILHLSIPVRDLTEASSFYVGTLGCQAARAREGYQDVWFYGMQITLQDRPEEVTPLSQGGVRHFGVTLQRDEFDEVVQRLSTAEVNWLVPVTTDDAGTDTDRPRRRSLIRVAT